MKIKTLIMFIFLLAGIMIFSTPVLSDSLSNFTEKTIKLGKLHPDWPLKTREAIAQGRVEKGMSPAQVIEAWGQPQRSLKADPEGNHQYWHYSEIVLYIKNHKVFEFRKKRRPH